MFYVFYVFLLLCVIVEITLLYLVSLYLLASRPITKATISAYMSLLRLIAHCFIELFTCFSANRMMMMMMRFSLQYAYVK